MKKITVSLIALLVLLGLPMAVAAQEDEAPEERMVYSTYFECDPNEVWLADMIAETVFKPAYDAAVEDGTLLAWGWLRHYAGGTWTRGTYQVAATLDGLLDAADAVNEKVDEMNAAASRKFSEVCNRHDDYIWRSAGGSGQVADMEVATAGGAAGVSMYMVCDMAKQGRADEIMEELASVYNAHVKEGELTSWGWLQHQVGGEYRRLLAMRGADHKSVLKAWGMIVDEEEENHEALSTEFSEICYTHQDYMWDIGFSE